MTRFYAHTGFKKNIEEPNGIDIDGHLTVLKALAGETKNDNKTQCIILEHILPTTVEYIDWVTYLPRGAMVPSSVLVEGHLTSGGRTNFGLASLEIH